LAVGLDNYPKLIALADGVIDFGRQLAHRGLDQLPVPTAAFEGLRRSSSIPA
jgi:hypothetical protein